MTIKKWTVIDSATRTDVGELQIGPADVGGTAQGYSVTKKTLRGGASEGVASVRLDNGTLALELLPTRGMGIWKAWLGGEEIGWQSPVRGPVHPAFVPVGESSGLGWLDGFDELLVRCGLESNGAPEFDEAGRVRYPLHGRIANRPAHRVDVEVDGDLGEISVAGEVEESRFLFHNLRLRSTLRTRVGEKGFRIRDEIQNASDRPASCQLLYHINFGPPWLDAGARFVAPLDAIAPRDERAAEGIATWDRYGDAEPGYAEQVYFLRFRADGQGQTQALLRNAQGTRGVSVHFQKPQLPCFTLWKNTAAVADGFVTGLEPATNFPNPRSYEEKQDRVIKLAPQDSYAIDLRLELHTSAKDVAQAEEAIHALQADAATELFDTPQRGWSR